LGDFVYNPGISATAPVGPISINKVGRGIMSPLYTVFKFHAGCVQFFEQYFQTTIWHPYLKSIANFGARFDRMNITSDGFFNMPLMLPTVPEQQKIAECLSAIDNNIADEAEKLESLRNHKKGLMQQLFPQPAK
jgi:type I restriction enzyme S subunit